MYVSLRNNIIRTLIAGIVQEICIAEVIVAAPRESEQCNTLYFSIFFLHLHCMLILKVPKKVPFQTEKIEIVEHIISLFRFT